jgi:antitoxin HicB
MTVNLPLDPEVLDYICLPYHILIERDCTDNQWGWVGSVKELPGCLSQAEGLAEIGPMMFDAMYAWIAAAMDDGQTIPMPESWE